MADEIGKGGDLISREQAMAVVAGLYGYDENHPDIDRAIAALRALPAAPAPQPWTEGELARAITDEKAIAIARQHPETLPSLFAWRTDDEEDLSKHHFTAQDLAADLLNARAEIASLRAKLAAVCDAAEDAIGFACQHDRNGFVTFIDRSQPVAQYSDDGPDAWPARLHAAIAAIRALPSAPAPLPWTEGALISALTRTEMNRYQAERVARIVLAGPGGKP